MTFFPFFDALCVRSCDRVTSKICQSDNASREGDWIFLEIFFAMWELKKVTNNFYPFLREILKSRTVFFFFFFSDVDSCKFARNKIKTFFKSTNIKEDFV